MMFARRVLRQSMLFVMKKVSESSEEDENVLDSFVSTYDENILLAPEARRLNFEFGV